MDGTATLAQRVQGHEAWAHLFLVLIVLLLVLHSYSATGPTFGLGVDLLEALGDTSPEPERLRGGAAGPAAARAAAITHAPRAMGCSDEGRRSSPESPPPTARRDQTQPLPNCLL